MDTGAFKPQYPLANPVLKTGVKKERHCPSCQTTRAGVFETLLNSILSSVAAGLGKQ